MQLQHQIFAISSNLSFAQLFGANHDVDAKDNANYHAQQLEMEKALRDRFSVKEMHARPGQIR